MSFRVEPGALETFAQSLGVLAGDAKKAKGYVQGNQKAVDSERGLLFGYVYALRPRQAGPSWGRPSEWP